MNFYACVLRMKIIILIAALSTFTPLFCPLASSAEEQKGFDLTAATISNAVKKVQWHGYYEFEYWEKENAKNSFDAHKITVWMGLPINDKVFLSTEIEYEHFPRLEDGTQKNGGSGEIKLDSANLRITPVPHTNFFAGVFYVPFGIEHFSYPGHKNKLVTRPKAMKSGSIVPGTWSDVGIGLNQVVNPLGEFSVYGINGDANNGGISRDSSTGGNENKSVGARLQLNRIIDGFNIGGSFVTGQWDEASHERSYRSGAHMRIDLDKISGVFFLPTFIGEYVMGVDEADSNTAGKDRDMFGYYAQISSKVHRTLELVSRFGQYNNDEDKKDNNRYEISFGFVVHLWENFQIKGEYQINQETGINKTRNNAAVLQLVAHW